MNTEKFYPCPGTSKTILMIFVGLLILAGPPDAVGMHNCCEEREAITLRGRLFTAEHEPNRRVELRIEATGNLVLSRTYTDAAGAFIFQDVPLGVIQAYVAVDLDGFEPYRQLLDGADSYLVVFLEPSRRATVPTGDGPYVVDVGQLQARIPKRAVALYEKGLEECLKGNVKKAVKFLKQALDLAPDFYKAHNTLGGQYLELREYRPAESEFQTAIELNPHAAEPYINLGILHYREAEMKRTAGSIDEAVLSFKKAVGVLESAIRYDPRSGPAHLHLGIALYKTGAHQRAEPMLHRALELDAALHDARLMLINVYTKQRRYDEALLELRTYLEENPKSPERAVLEGVEKQIEQILLDP